MRARSPARAAVALLALGAAALAGSDARPDGDGEAEGVPTITAFTDRDGCFVLAVGAPDEVWPGEGVRALVGRHGRCEPGAAEAFVFVRGRDGAFERRRLRHEVPQQERRTGFLKAAREWLEALAPGSAGSGERPRREPGTSGGYATPGPSSPPDVGAELSAWAPADCAFVRFRSVELAYRFADVADSIAARLLALAGDGRDHGTVRWALHDLVLPEIWRANPGTEKGVGECGLVVRPGTELRGRPAVALVLRLTDPELHRMQTEAGVSWAALPEHRWAPEDDPAPRSRAARNARRVVRDVEIVGTDPDLVAAIAAGPGDAVRGDAQWREANSLWRTSPGTVLIGVQSEAARAGIFGAASIAEDANRRRAEDSAGRAHVWREWTGEPAAPPNAAPSGPPLPVAEVLASVVSVSATTDPSGAAVEVRFADESGAARAAEALAAAARPFSGARAVCARNRRDLAPLAWMDRPRADLAERSFVVLGWRPVCPARGTYSAHPVTREVSCSRHGSDSSPVPVDRALPPVVRDVERDGAVVRFRAPIDW